MILQVRRNLAAERISALLFCLQLLAGVTTPALTLPSRQLPQGQWLAAGVDTALAGHVSMMPPRHAPTCTPRRVSRPLRGPGFKSAFCGECHASWTGGPHTGRRTQSARN
jgi:hypothetical protein